MTEQEKIELKNAVIAELKSQGTDVSKATVITDAEGISYVICYDTSGNIARCDLKTLNEKSGIDISWDSTLNLNDIITEGVYNIKGNRLQDGDNLPITNFGENTSFSARLIVTVSPEGTTTYRHIVGHTLILSNAEGHETKVYTRSGNRTSFDGGVSYVTTWGVWSMLQGNINVGAVESLDNLIDNGIYSGIYTYGSPETFVMVVINDYDASAKVGQVRRVSQFKYGVYTGSNVVKYLSRVGYGNDGITWDKEGWKPINQDEIKTMVEDAIKSILGDIDDDTLDTIKELADKVKKNESSIKTEQNRAESVEDAIKSKATHYNTLHFSSSADHVTLGGKSIDGNNTIGQDIPAATTEKAGVMTASDKSKLEYLAKINESYDLNTYTDSGVYLIQTSSNEAKNYPIQTPANSVLRLTVIDSYDGNNRVITQVLNINNFVGGEGGIYIRSNQNQTWKPWAKLQTNVEVGLIDQTKMDDLIDNGIYSGILSTTGETFVIICINNYAIAQQVGVHHISHLKYSLVVGTGEVKIEKRTRDAYGFWTDWENIGSGSTLSEATTETAGVVKLGKSNQGGYLSIGNIPSDFGSGLGFSIDSSIFSGRTSLGLRLGDGGGLTKNSGLSINLGTKLNGSRHNAIPLCVGTAANEDKFLEFTGHKPTTEVPLIPVNADQFILGRDGLELKNPSSAIKVTWDSSSNMNDYFTAGVYDIYGERTNLHDNLPIFNSNPGHSIAAKLTVVDSSLQKADGSAPTEIHLTQFLMLDNRVGPSADMYMRTYTQDNGHPNNGSGNWSVWKKFQGVEEYYLISDYYSYSFGDTTHKEFGMHNLIDNGIYSGIYFDGVSPDASKFLETFTLIVINNYAVAAQDSRLKRTISQLKYAVDAITNQATVKHRTKTDGGDWTDWQDIGGGGSNEVDITDAVKAYGLYTLIYHGLAKEGQIYTTSYIVLSDLNEKLDTKNKIYNHLLSKNAQFVKLKIIYNSFAGPKSISIEATDDKHGYYYKYMITELGYSEEAVRVSADMTTL